MSPDVFKRVTNLVKDGLTVLWVNFNDLTDKEDGLQGGEGGTVVKHEERVHQRSQKAGDYLGEGLSKLIDRFYQHIPVLIGSGSLVPRLIHFPGANDLLFKESNDLFDVA